MVHYRVAPARDLTVGEVRPVPLDVGVEAGESRLEIAAQERFPRAANDCDVRIRHVALSIPENNHQRAASRSPDRDTHRASRNEARPQAEHPPGAVRASPTRWTSATGV